MNETRDSNDVPEIHYETSLEHSLLQVEHNYEDNSMSYEYKMLSNDIIGILPLCLSYQDNKIVYSYDITGKISLKEYVKTEPLCIEDIKNLFLQIISTCQSLQPYLLPEDNVVLHPDYIYIKISSGLPLVAQMCYYVGYQVKLQNQLKELLEYFMKYIDYENQTLVSFIYELYQLSRDSSCTYDTLRNYINKDSYGIVATSDTSQDCRLDTIKESTIQTSCMSVLPEEISLERETLYYPYYNYVIVIISCIISIMFFIWLLHTTALRDAYYSYDKFKIGAVIVILCVANAYLIIKRFDTTNKRVKQKVQPTYIDLTGKESECSDIEQHQPPKEIHTVVMQQSKESAYDNNSTQENYETVVLSLPYVLTLIPEDQLFQAIIITKPITVIGNQNSSVEVTIDSTTISRTHAKIYFEQKKFYLVDLKSTNGTYVNGEQITEGIELKEKDIIQFANVSYEVHIQDKYN